MKKRWIGLMTGVAVLASALVGCTGTAASSAVPSGSVEAATSQMASRSSAGSSVVSGEQVDGGSLVRAMPTDISSLNILYETGDEGMTMLKPVYDPLYVVAKDEVRYYLADSHQMSEDGLSITIKLREGLKWHDGQPITTEDVLWNFEMRMNPENKSSSGTSVNGEPVTVEAVDDLTFTVTLPSVSASYVTTLGSMKLLPKHIYESTPVLSGAEINSEVGKGGIGSGPYKVKEWNKGESLVLERFADYYRGQASVETVVFKVVPNESAQEIAFQNKELNMLRLSTMDKFDKYTAAEDNKVWQFSEGRINYMGFNANSELTADPKLREAISLALNVDEMIALAYGGETMAAPAKTVFCPSNFYYSDVEGYSQDLERAKQLVAEAGAEGKTIRLVYNSSRENMENCALVIQQQLAEVGLVVDVQGFETQGFFEVFFYSDAGDWELGLNGYATNGDNQGNEYMFSSEGFLGKNICTTPEIAELWNQGDATTDPAQRADIYRQLQEQIRDAYTMFPISNPNFTIAVDNQYTGLDAIDIVPIFEDYTQIHQVS